MSVTVQKDSGSPTVATVQKKRKVLRVLLEVDDGGDHAISIYYNEWSEDANAVMVGSIKQGIQKLLEAELDDAARKDIDSVFSKALAAI